MGCGCWQGLELRLFCWSPFRSRRLPPIFPQKVNTSAPPVIAPVFALAAAGIFILAFAGSTWPALLGAAVLGVGLGSEADVGPYLLARYFGRRHFSVLYGLTWTAYAIGGATGPLCIGHLYDRAGAYLPRFIVYLAAVAFGAVILSFFLQSGRDSLPSERDLIANEGVPLEG